jgi:hypothetical protein
MHCCFLARTLPPARKAFLKWEPYDPTWSLESHVQRAETIAMVVRPDAHSFAAQTAHGRHVDMVRGTQRPSCGTRRLVESAARADIEQCVRVGAVGAVQKMDAPCAARHSHTLAHHSTGWFLVCSCINSIVHLQPTDVRWRSHTLMWRALEIMWPLIVAARAAQITSGLPTPTALPPLADMQALLIVFAQLDTLTQLVCFHFVNLLAFFDFFSFRPAATKLLCSMKH